MKIGFKRIGEKIGSGVVKTGSRLGRGIKNVADDIKERQKPENQLARLKAQKKVLYQKKKIAKLKADIQKQRQSMIPKQQQGAGMFGQATNMMGGGFNFDYDMNNPKKNKKRRNY